MPLYALDDEDHIVAAPDALSWRHYRCLECKNPMQKRIGMERRPHFYHLKTVRSCRLCSRSIDHLILQTDLQDQNPALQIERPFEKILRIADLCWEEKKLVFEIQCSPIGLIEAEQRIKDYNREGFTLIWLLDNRLYNRRHLRSAELHLRQTPCYYFSLGPKKVFDVSEPQKPQIFDQFEVIQNQSRIEKGPPLPIDLTRPSFLPSNLPSELTNQMKNRQAHIFFAGDLLDRSLRYPIYLKRLVEHEKNILSKQEHSISWIKKYFYITLEYLIRRSTKGY